MFWRKSGKSSEVPVAGGFTLGTGGAAVEHTGSRTPSNSDSAPPKMLSAWERPLVGREHPEGGIQAQPDNGRVDGRPQYVIPRGYKVSGNAYVPGSVRIDGEYDGKKLVARQVEVSPGATVSAPIEASVVYVAGIVTESVVASKRVELRATGTIASEELTTPALSVQPGGQLKCSALVVG